MVDQMLEAIRDDLNTAIEADKEQEAQAEAEATPEVAQVVVVAPTEPTTNDLIDAKLAAATLSWQAVLDDHAARMGERLSAIELWTTSHQASHDVELVPEESPVVEEIESVSNPAPEPEPRREPSKPPERHAFGRGR